MSVSAFDYPANFSSPVVGSDSTNVLYFAIVAVEFLYDFLSDDL